VTEDILTHLARVRDLFVVSSTAVLPDTGLQRPAAEIAAVLGVDYILRGSVRRDGERVRITAQLVDAKHNAHVWAETYVERLEDIFAVQSEIATRVAAALNAEIVSGVRERIARVPTEDLVAYNLYLRGRYFWHRRTQAGLVESVRFAVRHRVPQGEGRRPARAPARPLPRRGARIARLHRALLRLGLGRRRGRVPALDRAQPQLHGRAPVVREPPRRQGPLRRG